MRSRGGLRKFKPWVVNSISLLVLITRITDHKHGPVGGGGWGSGRAASLATRNEGAVGVIGWTEDLKDWRDLGSPSNIRPGPRGDRVRDLLEAQARGRGLRTGCGLGVSTRAGQAGTLPGAGVHRGFPQAARDTAGHGYELQITFQSDFSQKTQAPAHRPRSAS